MKKQIEIRKGDITKFTGDAIVNAANRSLLGGRGVDGAIHRAAGPELLVACQKLNGCPTGQAKITPGFRLSAKYIIHTVGPIWRGGTAEEAQLLKNAYLSSLSLAQKHQLRTIAFPAISTGVYAYPLKQATQIAIETILQWLSQQENRQNKVTFYCFTDNIYETYVDCLEAID